MTELERLQVVIEANTKPLQQELNKISGDLKGLEKTVSKSTGRVKSSFAEITVAVTAVGYAAKKAANMIVDLGKEAISVQAQSKNLQRVLGENADGFIEWARTGAEAYGISESAAIRYGNTFSNIVSGFTSDTGQMATLTQQMLQTASVIASKTGRTMDDVLTKIRSGLWGTTTAIDDLGINIKQNALEMTDAYKQIAGDKSWNQLNSSQQEAIRYFAILEQANSAYGTSLDPALQKQLAMTASLENLKLRLGEAFIPILQFVIPVIQHMVRWITIAANAITSFFAIFSGKKGEGGALDAGAKASESIASSLEDASYSTDNVDYSLDKGAKSAKKIKNLLAGFDELNIIQEPQDVSPSGGGGGGGGISGPGLDFGKVNIDGLFGGLNDELDVLEDRFDGISQVVAGLVLAIGGMWVVKKVSDFIGVIKDLFTSMGFLKGAADDADVGISNFRNGLGLTVLGVIGMVASLTTIVTKWQEMDTWQKILSAGLLLVSGALTAVGITAMVTGTSIAAAISVATLGVGALIAGVLGAIAAFANWVISSGEVNAEMKDVELQTKNLEDALDNLRNATLNNMNVVDRYESSLKTLEEAEKRLGISGADLEAQVKAGSLTYQDMTADQREVYKAYVNTKDAEDKLNKSQEELTQSTKDATLADYKHRLSLAHTSGEYDSYKKSVMDAYDQGMLSAEEARDLISGAMADMSRDSRETFVEDLPSDITDGLNPNKYSTATNKLENKFGDMWENVKEKAGDIWEDILNFFSEGGEIFDGIKEGIVDAFKSVVNKLISGINRLIATPFNKINNLLNTIRSISVLGIKPFKGLWNYNPLPVPQIPKLATGTNYVQREGLAYIHEGEAVVPKKYNPAAGGGGVEQIILLQEQNGLLRQLLEKDSGVYLDGKEITDSTVKNIKQRERLTGKPVFGV